MKPTIPAEVADAIEQAKAESLSNASIIDVRNEEHPEGMLVSGAALRQIPFDTLLAALVNGYEREMTEEERSHDIIREMYEDPNDSDYADGVQQRDTIYARHARHQNRRGERVITRLKRYAEIAATTYVVLGTLTAIISWAFEPVTLFQFVIVVMGWPFVPLLLMFAT